MWERSEREKGKGKLLNLSKIFSLVLSLGCFFLYFKKKPFSLFFVGGHGRGCPEPSKNGQAYIRIESYPSSHQEKTWENSLSQVKMLCISSILNGFFNFWSINLEDIISSTFWKEDLPKSERPRKRKRIL